MLLKGFIVNKFRGDIRLFDDGVAIIHERTKLPSLGVVPYLESARRLPAEDAVALSSYETRDAAAIRIAVILLPGSKATIADLAFLRAQGWHIDIAAHVRRGGRVLGLCGGYQMLGRRLADPRGIEGPAGAVDGLALLDVDTELTDDKTLVEVRGEDIAGTPLSGYEMHVGITRGPATARPMLKLTNGTSSRAEGAMSADGRVAGCYLHGLFASDAFRHAFLATLKPRAASGLMYEHEIESTLDALADHLAAHLDLDRILQIAMSP
jgi:adenosylcobyric acid synthase